MENFDNRSIYSLLFPSFANSMYSLFNYLDISKLEIERIILFEIENNKKFYQEDESYAELIKKKTIQRLTNITNISLQENDRLLKIVNNILVINQEGINIFLNGIKEKKYLFCLKRLKRLGLFFDTRGFLPTADIIKTLLDNTYLKEIIEIVVDNNIEKIKNGMLDTLFNSQSIILIIDEYCLQNGIEIREQTNFEEVKEKCLDSHRLYMNDVVQIPLLTKEEEIELGRRIKEGDMSAKTKLIESNLRFVVSIAKHYIGRGIPFSDLIQEGNIGLIIAAGKYDADMGFGFTTYACHDIRQKILRAISKQSIVKVSSNVEERIFIYKRNLDELSKKLGRIPTDEEVVKYIKENTKYTDITINDIIQFNILINGYTSLNRLIGEEEDSELGDYCIPSDDNVEKTVFQNALGNSLENAFKYARLSEKQKDVLKERYGIIDGKEKTLEEIAKKYDVTRERIRQIESKSIICLRLNNQASDELAEYTDNPEQAIQDMIEFRKVYMQSKYKHRKRLIKKNKY